MDVAHRLPRGRSPRLGTRADRTRCAAVIAATALLVAVSAVGRAAPPAPSLNTPVTATWRGLPVRDWAGRAATMLGRPVVVDRRIDPDSTVTRDCRDEPLGDVLDAVAAGAAAQAEPLRSWVRLAPVAAAGRATLGERRRTEELAALGNADRTTLNARRPWSWADGARPRDLVAAAATDGGLTVAGLESVPHDHLPAATLPPLSLAERLDLLLAHYDLRVSWRADDDETVRGTIVPLPAAGPVAPPERNKRPTRAGPAAAAAAKRFTLRLEAPLAEALAALGPKLGLETRLDRESLEARGILPNEIVRVAVTDATLEEMLDAVVAPLGLRWRIDDGVLVVDAAP